MVAAVPDSEYEGYWQREFKFLRVQYRVVFEKYFLAQGLMRQVSGFLGDIVSPADCTLVNFGAKHCLV
jgi:hypothetical protein